jgi:hypothetical protein
MSGQSGGVNLNGPITIHGSVAGRDLVGGQRALEFIWKGKVLKAMAEAKHQIRIQSLLDKFQDKKISADYLREWLGELSPNLLAQIEKDLS